MACRLAGDIIIGPLGTNFSEILIGIQTFSFKKMHLKMPSAKWRPFSLGLNVLTQSSITWYCTHHCRNGGRTSIRVWSTKDTPYLPLMGKLWGFFRKHFGEIWPRCNGTAMCLFTLRECFCSNRLTDCYPLGPDRVVLRLLNQWRCMSWCNQGAGRRRLLFDTW